MTVLHVEIDLDDADHDYINGAVLERRQALEDFVKEALLEYAAR